MSTSFGETPVCWSRESTQVSICCSSGAIQSSNALRSTRDRIEQAYAFKAGAALALAAVGHHNVIEGRLFAAASSQPDRHHR